MPFVILLLLPKILISSSDARIWFFDLIGRLSWPMQYSFPSAPILSPDIYRFVEQLRSIKPVQVVYQQQELYFDVIAIISYWLTTINGSTINLARVSHELSEKEVLLKPLINSKSATMDTSLIYLQLHWFLPQEELRDSSISCEYHMVEDEEGKWGQNGLQGRWC